MKFKDLITKNKFTLVVSLPSNRIDLAEAAMKGGASAVKVHMNVWHRASNNTFGNFRDNKQFMSNLIAIDKTVSIGLVPGGEKDFISNEERVELEDMGLDFFSTYSQHLPLFMMESERLTKMVAVDSEYNQNTLDAVRMSNIDVLEASVMKGDLYGQPLNFNDVMVYSDLVRKTDKPLLVPTQKKIKPSEVKHLYEAGCKAIMIGAIVFDGETPEDCKRVTASFREAIENLG